MDGANAVWFLRHTVKKLVVPHDNVTLAYKFLRMSKNRGIRWLQLVRRENSKSVQTFLRSPLLKNILNTRAKETFGSSNNNEYFLCGEATALKFIDYESLGKRVVSNDNPTLTYESLEKLVLSHEQPDIVR